MLRFLFVIILVVNIKNNAIAQKELCSLPAALNETSGLAIINDSLFITINDGGNSPILFVLNEEGEVKHTCKITNAKNTDWEDLAIDDKGFLYIGDFGNNKNKRKKLSILKVEVNKVLQKHQIDATKYHFQYPDQKNYPPAEDKLHYDAEACVFYKKNLWIFTKNRTQPFDGHSFSYALKLKSDLKIKKHKNIQLPKTNWMEESITSADIFDNKLYILTYSKIYVYAIIEDNLNWDKTIELSTYNQWEAIAVNKNGIYITNESNILMPAKLHKIVHNE